MRPETLNDKQLSKLLGDFKEDAKASLILQYLAKHPRCRMTELKRVCTAVNIGDVARVANRRLRKHGFMIGAHPSPIPYVASNCSSAKEYEWSICRLSPAEKKDPDIKPTIKDPLWKKRREWLVTQAESLANEINGLIAKTRMGLPAE